MADVAMRDTLSSLDQEKENPIIPELFMQTVAAHEFFFTKARNILEQDGGISNDLELLQKEFSNLKDSFFLLETKLGMLERLSTQTAFDSVTPASITQLGVDVSEAKKRLSSIKREMELLKARLREVVDDLAKKTRELAQSKAEFEKVYNSLSIEERKAQLDLEAILEENANSAAFGSVSPSILVMDTEQKCRTVMTLQLQVVNQLEEEMESLDAQTGAEESSLASSRAQITALERELEEMRVTSAATGPQMEYILQQTQWFLAASALYRSISGINVDLSGMMPPLPTHTSSSLIGKSHRGGGFHATPVPTTSTSILRFRLRPVLLRPGLASPAATITATLTQVPLRRDKQNSWVNTPPSIFAPQTLNQGQGLGQTSGQTPGQGTGFEITHLSVSSQGSSVGLVVPGLQEIVKHALKKQDLRFFILAVQRKLFENSHKAI